MASGRIAARSPFILPLAILLAVYEHVVGGRMASGRIVANGLWSIVAAFGAAGLVAIFCLLGGHVNLILFSLVVVWLGFLIFREGGWNCFLNRKVI